MVRDRGAVRGDNMYGSSRSGVRRYGAAVAAVVIAAATRLALDPLLGDTFAITPLLFAILIVAGYGGRGPALLTTILGGVVAARFLFPPRAGFAELGAEDRAGLVFYLAIGLGIAILGGSMRKARRRAEANEAEAVGQRELLQATFASIGDAIIATDGRGRVASINPVAVALTGWTAEEATGRLLEEVFWIVHEGTTEPAEASVTRAVREGLSVGLTDHTVLISRGGDRTPIENSAAPIRSDSGVIAGGVMVFRDVTESRRSERALRENEARKAAILKAALDCIISMDHEGKVIEFNPAAEATFGYARSEALGQEMAALIIPPSLRDAHRRGLAHYLATGEGPVLGRRIEITAMRADGSEFPIELAITRVSVGGPPTFTAYLRDITERKRQEHEIAEQKRLAEFGRDIGLALTEAASLSEMLARTAEVTVRHLDGAFARIWTVDEAGEVLELRASAGMYTHLDGPHSRIPVGQYKIGLIAQERRPHLTNSVIGDPRVPSQDWAEREGMVAFAGYPLVVEDRLLGVWAIFARHALSEATLGAMESVAKGIALGIERKRAAEILAESESWLATTLASIGDAVIATDGQGRVKFMNPVAEGLTGWTQPEASARPMEAVFRIISEQTRRPAEHPVQRVLRDGVIVGLANHTVLIARDETETAIEDSAAPIRGVRGEIIGVVLVFRDASEQRRHEAQLRNNDERHRALLESISDGFFAVGRDWRFTYVNRQAEILLGRSRDDLLGKDHWEEYPEAVGTEVERNYLRALAEDVAVAFETFFSPHDRWYEIHAYPSPEGLSVYFRDVTERRRHQEELRASEERLRFTLDATKVGQWDLDLTTDTSVRSLRHDQIFGHETPLPNWGFDSFLNNYVHQDDRDGVERAFRLATEEGQAWESECRIIRADGVERWIWLKSGVYLTNDGKPMRMLGLILDITDQKRAEEAVRVARDEAEHANKAKDQFLAVLSHELRTPLNPILLAASSMLEQMPEPGELRPTLEMIRQNVNLQARLIDDLLDVMRIVRGKMPLHWEVADAHALIREAVTTCRSEVFGKELRLEMDLGARGHHLNADPARFQQVIWNLVKNAVKFTPSGGAITIRTRNRDSEGGGPLLIEVTDTGIGIEPEILPLIFDPFQQGESQITRKFGGLGLGLAICRGIVESHGGWLTAESEGKDRGTTFRIALQTIPSPAETDRRPTCDPPESTPTAPPSLKILVVEDEPATRRLMARLLRVLGHEVTAASTIAEAVRAVDAAGAEAFNLIVSDIGLPDGSGLDLIRRVVAARGPVPSIALTGYGMEEDIMRSREAGFTAHMTKPIDFTKLEAMIRQVAD